MKIRIGMPYNLKIVSHERLTEGHTITIKYETETIYGIRFDSHQMGKAINLTYAKDAFNKYVKNGEWQLTPLFEEHFLEDEELFTL